MKLYDWSVVCDEVTRPAITAADELWKLVTGKEIFDTGLFGHLWTADIHVSSRIENEKPKLGPVV
jgi:hypothetical protein